MSFCAPFCCNRPNERWCESVKKVYRSTVVYGVERQFCILLKVLQGPSISYFLKRRLPQSEFGGRYATAEERKCRDRVIECYVLGWAILLALVLFGAPVLPACVAYIIASYALFEIYLNMCCIVFLGKIEGGAPPISIERSLILMFVNLAQIILAFAIIYHAAIPGVSRLGGVIGAALVLGTVGYPANGGHVNFASTAIALQIFLDLVFIVLFVGAYSGQLTVFKKETKTRRQRIDRAAALSRRRNRLRSR